MVLPSVVRCHLSAASDVRLHLLHCRLAKRIVLEIDLLLTTDKSHKSPLYVSIGPVLYHNNIIQLKAYITQLGKLPVIQILCMTQIKEPFTNVQSRRLQLLDMHGL